MRLTSFTDYGLRLLMRMAGEPDRLFTTQALAQELDVSRHHLVKVVRELARAGVLGTRKGAAGGIFLVQPAETLRLGALVRLLEGRSVLVECFRPRDAHCPLLPACLLRARLADAREAFFAELDKTTLADCALPAALQERFDPDAGKSSHRTRA